MASNRLKPILKEQIIGLYEEPKRPPNKSEKLFDDLFGKSSKNCENYSKGRRVPLTSICANLGNNHKSLDSRYSDGDDIEFVDPNDEDFEPSAKNSRTRVRNKGINRVKFIENSIKRVNKKPQNKKNVTKKNKDYPDCTKETLLKAYESANLPDFEEIARHELFVTKFTANDCLRPDPPTPPLADILAPFEDLIDWTKEGLYSNKSESDVGINSVEEFGQKSSSDWETDSNQNSNEFILNENQSVIQNEKKVRNNKTNRNKSKISDINYKNEELQTAGLGASRVASTPTRARKLNVTLKTHTLSPIKSIDSPESTDNKTDHNFVVPLLPPPRPSNRIKSSLTQESTRLDIVNPTLTDLNKVRVGSNRTVEVSRSLIKDKTCVSCKSSEESSDEIQTLVEDNNTINENNDNMCSSSVSTIGSSNTFMRTRSKGLLKNKSNDLSSIFAPMFRSTPLVSTKQSFQNRLMKSKFDLIVDKTHFDESMTNLYRSQSLTQLNANPIKTTTIVPVLDTESVPKKHVSNAYQLYRKSIASVHSIYNKSCQPFRTVVRTSTTVGLNTNDLNNRTILTGLTNKEDLRQCIDDSLSIMFSASKVVFDDGNQEVLTSKQKVLLLCEPNDIIKFKDVLKPHILDNCKKIGEGSYGEVFASKDECGNDIVIKIIPLNMSNAYNEEEVFAQILPELMISNTFNRLKNGVLSNRAPNFIHMLKATTTQGLFPKKLIDEWNAFAQQKQSENDDPKCYTRKQLYLVLQLANGGTDIESYKFKSAVESLSIFAQLALALAAAESEYEFEHRDMHWGNVLICNSTQTYLNYTVKGVDYVLKTNGVFASLIDFSLSRMTNEGFIIYDDLAKYSDLFEGQGDYQFQVYRMMKEVNQNNWQIFVPKTNIFWLHYMLDKLIKEKKYSNRSKLHKNCYQLLKDIYKHILQYESAVDLVESYKFGEYLGQLE